MSTTDATAVESLRAVPIFAGCSSAELAEIAPSLEAVPAPAGTVIFSKGDLGDDMYIVVSGQVRIVSDIETEEEILAHLGPGGVFGEMALLTGSPRSAGALATTDVRLWRLGKDQFDIILREHPQVSIEITRIIGERVERRKPIGRHLKGRTALVTGASRGIGVYIARALATEGMNLVLAARSAAPLEKVRDEVKGLGVRALAVPTDVGEISELRALVERATSEFGAIDVLVNNAGIQLTLAYHKLKPEEIEDLIRVNLAAPMLLTWLVIPGMLERGWGHIVHISSLAAKAGAAYSEPYAATKAGLVGFAQSFRATYRGSGISASVVSPGFVEAGIYARSKKAGLSGPRILGASTPEAVARAVVRAIEKDLPEVIVNPAPMRLFLALGTLSPGLAEWIRKRVGADTLFRKAAEIHGRRRATAKLESQR